jgi:hypothetical protein
MAQQDPTATGPSMPVAPQYVAQPEAAAPPVERPSGITRAVQLMYVGAGLGVVGIALGWATKSQLHDKIANGSTRSASDVDALVTTSLVTATIVGLIGVGLWLWMAAANKAGRSWARIVATVFGGLNVVFTLLGLTQSSGASIALDVVSLVLAVTILVLLWKPESSAYYKAKSAPGF